ncbi:MAG: PEP-CTERM sorting domain-containing protein [Bryobacterales bacterium]|nr:PEP-CTERM sorting domain-containing protein [Bryobacterales bacterium]
MKIVQNNQTYRAFLLLAAWAAVGLIPTQTAGAAMLAWDITGGELFGLSGTPRANGAQFSVGTSTTVMSLGIWDDGADGLAESHLIRLWTETGTLLAEATVDNASTSVASASTLGLWVFEGITPLVLAPGTYRIVAGYATNADPVRYGTTSVTSIAATYIQEAYTGSGAGVSSFPNNLTSNPVFGANFQVASSTVPEPGSLSLLLSGVALCAWRLRKKSV